MKPAMHSNTKPATCRLLPQVRIDDVSPFLIGQVRVDFMWTDAVCAGFLRPDRAMRHIRLIVQINDPSRRMLAESEISGLAQVECK